jgi:hypothetical protein
LGRALSRTIGVEPRTVPADNFDLRMSLEPLCGGRCRAICQEVDHPMAFEVDDDPNGYAVGTFANVAQH